MDDSAAKSDLLRLERLANDKCNGTLGPEGHAELHELLSRNLQLRLVYWQIMAIHAELEWDHLGGHAPIRRDVRSAPEQRDASRTAISVGAGIPRRTSSRWQAVMVAAAVAVIVSGWALWDRRSARPDIASADSRRGKPAPAHFASLASGSRWSCGRPGEWNPADFYYGDTVSVDAGVVAMRLENGAVGELQTSAVMQLLSSNRVRLISGKIKVYAPESAHGFTVETPSAEVVDLGTTFSVEAAETGTDLIVFGGKVDIKVPTNGQVEAQPVTTKQFTTGQAVRVAPNGTLSRIMHVNSPADPAKAGEHTRESLIASVVDNIVRDDFWAFYEVVQGGMAEDAPVYVDRFFEWNGATASGIPAYLLGGDYVKTFNDDKLADQYQIAVTLAQPVTLYVLMDPRVTPPEWLTRSFTETGDVIGIDESHHHLAGGQNALDAGPGNSIDRTRTIWQTTVPEAGTIVLGRNGKGRSRAVSMYSIVAVPLRQGE